MGGQRAARAIQAWWRMVTTRDQTRRILLGRHLFARWGNRYSSLELFRSWRAEAAATSHSHWRLRRSHFEAWKGLIEDAERRALVRRDAAELIKNWSKEEGEL